MQAHISVARRRLCDVKTQLTIPGAQLSSIHWLLPSDFIIFETIWGASCSICASSPSGLRFLLAISTHNFLGLRRLRTVRIPRTHRQTAPTPWMDDALPAHSYRHASFRRGFSRCRWGFFVCRKVFWRSWPIACRHWNLYGREAAGGCPGRVSARRILFHACAGMSARGQPGRKHHPRIAADPAGCARNDACSQVPQTQARHFDFWIAGAASFKAVRCRTGLPRALGQRQTFQLELFRLINGSWASTRGTYRRCRWDVTQRTASGVPLGEA